ncbi:hypothetical protein Tco_1117704 [Tanacetum coccineum]
MRETVDRPTCIQHEPRTNPSREVRAGLFSFADIFLIKNKIWDGGGRKLTTACKGYYFDVPIPEDMILQIKTLKIRKEMWEAIKTRNLGADRVKEARLQTLITEFENLKMSDNGTIDEYATKLSGIASKSATLGEVMSEHKLVNNFLTSLPRRFVHIVAALEKVLDLKETGFEDVFGRLKVYEERVMKKESNKKIKQVMLKNNHLSKGRGCDSYSRGRGQDQGRSWDYEANLNETQDGAVNHEEDTFFMMNHVQETNFMNEKKYTPPKIESNAEEDDVWYFDNGASNHMTGNYSYFSKLNENITDHVRFGDGSYVSIKVKGSILFQGKNGEQKLLKDIYYIPVLRSNVISLE